MALIWTPEPAPGSVQIGPQGARNRLTLYGVRRRSRNTKPQQCTTPHDSRRRSRNTGNRPEQTSLYQPFTRALPGLYPAKMAPWTGQRIAAPISRLASRVCS
jgi:hypothetical protein